MCIAIYSPVGIETPCEKYLKTAFENNPDGAGFAFNTDDGRVKILKGFMTWESFLETYKQYHEKYSFKDRGVLIHFRISTHGGICPECTHPFPLSSDAGALQKLTTTSNYAIIHNGIISLTGAEANKLQHMSDTMVFISKYMSKIAQYKNWFDNPVSFELFYDLAGSKIAVLRGDGSIRATYGFTKEEADGNFYSNQTYKETRVRYSYPASAGSTTYPYSYGRYDPYDDEEDWDGYGYGGYSYQHKNKGSAKQDKGAWGNKPMPKPKNVALMQLPETSVINNGGCSYTVDAADKNLYYCDAEGNTYYLFDGEYDDKQRYIADGLILFLEKCTITDASGVPIRFKADHWAKSDTIC